MKATAKVWCDDCGDDIGSNERVLCSKCVYREQVEASKVHVYAASIGASDELREANQRLLAEIGTLKKSKESAINLLQQLAEEYAYGGSGDCAADDPLLRAIGIVRSRLQYWCATGQESRRVLDATKVRLQMLVARVRDAVDKV